MLSLSSLPHSGQFLVALVVAMFTSCCTWAVQTPAKPRHLCQWTTAPKFLSLEGSGTGQGPLLSSVCSTGCLGGQAWWVQIPAWLRLWASIPFHSRVLSAARPKAGKKLTRVRRIHWCFLPSVRWRIRHISVVHLKEKSGNFRLLLMTATLN